MNKNVMISFKEEFSYRFVIVFGSTMRIILLFLTHLVTHMSYANDFSLNRKGLLNRVRREVTDCCDGPCSILERRQYCPNTPCDEYDIEPLILSDIGRCASGGGISEDNNTVFRKCHEDSTILEYCICNGYRPAMNGEKTVFSQRKHGVAHKIGGNVLEYPCCDDGCKIKDLREYRDDNVSISLESIKKCLHHKGLLQIISQDTKFQMCGRRLNAMISCVCIENGN